MKRLLAIFLATVMICSLAMAESGTETGALSWDDVKEKAEQIGGEFIQVEDPPCSVWVPASFEVKAPENDEEGEGYGTSFRLAAKDEAFSGIEITVSRTPSDAYRDAKAEIMEKLRPYAADLKDCTLNGWPAIIYSRQISDDDFRVFSVIWDESYPVIITAFSESPIENEEFYGLFEIISASYHP